MTEWICAECGWLGEEDELLTEADPFDEGESLWACPQCLKIDSFLRCCDEPGCREIQTCGIPATQDYAYRLVCRKHYDQIKNEQRKEREKTP